MGRFEIATNQVPPEPPRVNVDPIVKYHANKNMKSIMIEFNMNENKLNEYVNYLGKTLNKVQIANLFADYRRLQASCKNYFNINGKKLYNIRDDEDIETMNRILRREF